MRTVYTQNELEEAIKAYEEKILCKGEIARQFAKKKKRKRAARIGVGGALIAIGGIAAIPLTGGASLLGTLGATAVGLTVGSITISAAELAILLGGIVALTGIVSGGKVTFKNDGSVEFDPKYNKEKE